MKIKRIYLLIPLYNDWISLNRLLKNINKNTKIKNVNFHILVVNDCSIQKRVIFKNRFKNVKSIKILNLKFNFGHDRAIAIGLKYLYKYKSFDYVITMDSDGEDNPKYLKKFIKKIKNHENLTIVARRKKRSVGTVFSFLYFLHLLFLFFFVGKWINYGAYNCLSKSKVKYLLKEKTLWGNYSATIFFIDKKLISLDADRSKRYYGPSQMNYYKLFLHSLSIFAVFKKNVFYKVFLLLFLNLIIIIFNNSFIFYISLLFILFFGMLILGMSFRENNLWQNRLSKSISSISNLY